MDRTDAELVELTHERVRHAGARARLAREVRTRGRKRPYTRPVIPRRTTVIDGVAGADAFTFTGKIDGRALVPGSYSLLAVPTTDGIAGQQQQTTFELKR